MKSYSKSNLLKQKFNKTNKSFWSILTEPTYQYLEIELPYYDYLRGNVLLSDMKLVVEDCPKVDITQLIYLLYIQFLYQVRNGFIIDGGQKKKLDIKTLGYMIITKMEDYVDGYKEKTTPVEQMKMISNHTWILETIQEKVPKSKIELAYLTIKVKKSEVYRGEVLIHDISQVIDNFNIDVEDLFSMLYIDFITKIKTQGNDEKIINAIVSSYEQYYDFF